MAAAVAAELHRQQSTLEMIASENFAPVAVMQAQGSVLTNKYAEGYPGRRYYGGCEHVDVTEQLAIDRVKSLFGAEFANVQPHSGAQANTAVFFALLQPGDTILGLSLAHGGHLTHGMKINYSGRMFEVVPYQVSETDGLVDMDEVERLAREHRPKMIIAGLVGLPAPAGLRRASARIADEVGAYLMVDMAHFAGLVAAGLHPSPVPHAHVTTTTTHKTLGGPRGGVILTNDPAIAKKVNSAVFPGMQGGPLEHVIAGQGGRVQDRCEPRSSGSGSAARCEGARILAERLVQPDAAEAGVTVLTGGTDVHLVLVDLRASELDGRQAEDRLHDIGITVNRNAVPFDPRPPMVTSGLRIGTPALATRGFDARRLPRGRRHHRRGAAPGPGGRRHAPACGPACPPSWRDARSTRPWKAPASDHPHLHRPAGATDPGRRPPEHPAFLWRNVEPKKHYDVVDHRRWRPRARDGVLPGEEPRHHQRRGAGEGVAGGRQHGPQHHDHPVQLPVGRERRHLRALAQAVGGAGRGARLPDPVQPARRAQPRAQPAGRPRQRAPGQRQQAQRDRRGVGGRRSRSRSCARSSTSRPDVRYPVLGATYQPRAGIAKHDYVAWGFARAADATGRRPDPGLRGDRHRHRRRAG